jgi:hypothetical protein
MEATFSSETSVDFQLTTLRHISEERILHSFKCFNLYAEASKKHTRINMQFHDMFLSLIFTTTYFISSQFLYIISQFRKLDTFLIINISTRTHSVVDNASDSYTRHNCFELCQGRRFSRLLLVIFLSTWMQMPRSDFNSGHECFLQQRIQFTGVQPFDAVWCELVTASLNIPQITTNNTASHPKI